MGRVVRLLALCLALACAACGAPHDPAPTVAGVAPIRGALSIRRGDVARVLADEERVERGDVVETGPDGRGSLALDEGAWILLDQATRLASESDAWTLGEGRIWVDASAAGPTTIRTAQGTLRAEGASFAVAIEGESTRVYCGAGEVTYQTPGGEGRLAQGESLRVAAGAPPEVGPEALWDDWTGGLANPSGERLRGVERVGVLAGRTLGEIGRARLPLPVRAHEVRVEITGDLARTEVEQTFFNARSEVLEGEWSVRLPTGALVEGFAVDAGDGFVDASIRPVGTASGDAPNWAPSTVPGSKLVWDGPDRVRARVYPIAPGATVRLRLRYTERLARRGEVRSYVYPMRPTGEPARLGEFLLSVDTRGASARALRAGLGATVEDGRVRVRGSDVRPRADFVLDLYDTEEAARGRGSVQVHTAAPLDASPRAEGPAAYALFEVPTESLGGEVSVAPLDLVLVVDASGATEVEDLELARAVVEATLRQLAPTDRVALRLADVHARVPEGGVEALAEASPAHREALLASLARVETSGATDLGASLREAAALVAGRPRGTVLYLGDGMPTTGALDATSLRAQLALIDLAPRFVGLAIGEASNVDLLRAIFDGHADRVSDREAAARAVMARLAEAARPSLRGVTVDLGEGVDRVVPRGPVTIERGRSILVSARVVDAWPTEVVVRGTADGAPFERRLPVADAVVDASGDVRRRWAAARLAELVDADAGREALVELGVRFSLLTPWTALSTDAGAIVPIPLTQGFDADPLELGWDAPLGVPVTTSPATAEEGWRRRSSRAARVEPEAAPESTWTSHVADAAASTGPVGLGAGGDGGLAVAAAQRTLRQGERGPRGCYERRALVRPDLAGAVSVEVEVGGDGAALGVRVASSTLADPDAEACMLTEVRGLRFPASGGGRLVVSHTYSFEVAERLLGSRRNCSDASRLSLEDRRRLWRERLDEGADWLALWRQARGECELPTWSARRALLDLFLARSPSLATRIDLYRALATDPATEAHLRRAVYARVRSLSDADAVRRQLGLDVALDWSFFSRLWWAQPAPAARLALVRRWLEVLPDDLDLRVRLLSLLEETSALAEARRVARALDADPLADAAVRTAVGEFWLRQGDEAEARRAFSALVERTPFDPWARRRLGDLYRAHGWSDDAYREYRALARLTPDDASVALLLARAAADAGRIDEALRLEQGLSEAADAAADEGAASVARLWTAVRLARLSLEAEGEAGRDAIRRRMRSAGALRAAPDVLVALVWSHPDDAPRLRVHHPGVEDAEAFDEADLGAAVHGLVAIRVAEREAGPLVLEVRRDDREALRATHAELVVLVRPGAPDARVLRQPIELTRTARVRRYALGPDDTLAVAPLPRDASP